MISFQLGFLDPFILIPDGKAAEGNVFLTIVRHKVEFDTLT